VTERDEGILEHITKEKKEKEREREREEKLTRMSLP